VDGTRLPLQVETSRWGHHGALQLAVRWQGLSPAQQEDLERVLYRRDGLWPSLRAPFEPRALLAVALRLPRKMPPEAPFRRSLIPQNTFSGPIPSLQPRR
jgi:cellulose synthase (UDP-forming)